MKFLQAGFALYFNKWQKKTKGKIETPAKRQGLFWRTIKNASRTDKGQLSFLYNIDMSQNYSSIYLV